MPYPGLGEQVTTLIMVLKPKLEMTELCNGENTIGMFTSFTEASNDLHTKTSYNTTSNDFTGDPIVRAQNRWLKTELCTGVFRDKQKTAAANI